jgi:beta-mannosidase
MSATVRGNVPRRFLPTRWQLARLSQATSRPTANAWMPARVPGAVQLDWARARHLPDFNYGQNVAAYAGLEDFHWLYRTHVPAVRLRPHEELALVGMGIDHHAEIRVGGGPRGTHTGINRPFDINLVGIAPGTPVEILIHPAPKLAGAPPDRSQASHSTKAPVSYGWDWHPRLIPLGLSGEARFVVRPKAHIRRVDFRYELADDFASVHIELALESSTPTGWHWSLRDPSGRLVVESATPHVLLKRPQLWWTHDHGAPALYELEVKLDAEGGDTVRRQVGFRRVRLVMHEGAWEHPASFPKSRSHPPITLELNGRRLFAKGSNWVNPEIFPGRIASATVRRLVTLARRANFNLLRCWGGAAVPPESFFAECDRLGLLVWQEFPLACNRYPDTPAYLRELDEESRAIVHRIRQHPCLALWSGGNELFNAWSGMDDQSHALRLLNRNCFDLDRATPFIPTAPLDGMGHGDYRFRDLAERDIFQIFQSAANTAYSEFGCPGPSPVAYLRKFIPKDELWPPRHGTSWETHHGFGAWDIDPTTWLCTTTLAHYFGESASLAQLVARGEWLQGEGLKSVFEEARRQSPRCAMALNWCFNEPWPCAANNSIVNHPAAPKRAFASVAAACRPFLASARIPQFAWRSGETFRAEIWLLNDAPVPQAGGELVATLLADGAKHELLRWAFPAVPAQKNLCGPSVAFVLPECVGTEFSLRLAITGRRGASSSYRLPLRSSAATQARATRVLNT